MRSQTAGVGGIFDNIQEVKAPTGNALASSEGPPGDGSLVGDLKATHFFVRRIAFSESNSTFGTQRGPRGIGTADTSDQTST